MYETFLGFFTFELKKKKLKNKVFDNNKSTTFLETVYKKTRGNRVHDVDVGGVGASKFTRETFPLSHKGQNDLWLSKLLS